MNKLREETPAQPIIAGTVLVCSGMTIRETFMLEAMKELIRTRNYNSDVVGDYAKKIVDDVLSKI